MNSITNFDKNPLLQAIIHNQNKYITLQHLVAKLQAKGLFENENQGEIKSWIRNLDFYNALLAGKCIVEVSNTTKSLKFMPLIKAANNNSVMLLDDIAVKVIESALNEKPKETEKVNDEIVERLEDQIVFLKHRVLCLENQGKTARQSLERLFTAS